MEPGASTRSRRRHLVGAAAVGAIWWVGFQAHEAIPLLMYVNLGIHDLGHLLTYGFSDLVTALMGSVAQIGVPLLLAGYFLLRRDDWVAGALCLAWAATSALDVAIYVADAPYQELQLIGGSHDWAFILGPDGYAAIDKAASLAETIRDSALITIIMAFALCVAGFARDPAHDGATAATSSATADSSPWAASPTSGSAPRSASSPQYTPPS